MPRPLVINRDIVIPAGELHITFARSAGPGGQNVNKVSSKAIMRWRVTQTASLAESVRQRFVQRYANRINAAGELVLSADEHREQSRNLAACRRRLHAMVLSVLRAPPARIKTRPSRAAVERRVAAKRRAAEKKQRRRFHSEE